MPTGYRLVSLDEVDSTNAEAVRLARADAPAPTVVWAREQTGGRGRRGRPWRTGVGNLACSILLRPSASPQAAAQLGFVAALAIADLASVHLPAARVRVKWPNDVLVDERKVSGILIESAAANARRVEWVVVGMGVNLVSHPEGTETPATDFAAAGSPGVRIEAALSLLADRFEHWRALWAASGFLPLRDAWMARAWRVGEPIRVRLERETLEGRFAGLDKDGVLVLELSSGIKRMVAAGEVFPVTVPGEDDAAGGGRR